MKTLLKEQRAGLKERRLTRRVEKLWRDWIRAHGETVLPSPRVMETLDIGVDRDFCFSVDLQLSAGFPYFTFMGEGLTRFSTIYLSGRGMWEQTLLDMATRKMDEAALNRAPVFYDDVLRIYDRRRIVFRSVLLPLSDDGETVTHIFGAANGKGL